MERQQSPWVSVVIAVGEGRWDGLRCPENDDADMLVEWLPFRPPDERGLGRGEFVIHCPACGVRNYMLVSTGARALANRRARIIEARYSDPPGS